MNGSVELQRRFTREPSNDVSVASGKINKSFQFGHIGNALISVSSGNDSSSHPVPERSIRSVSDNANRITNNDL